MYICTHDKIAFCSVDVSMLQNAILLFRIEIKRTMNKKEQNNFANPLRICNFAAAYHKIVE